MTHHHLLLRIFSFLAPVSIICSFTILPLIRDISLHVIAIALISGGITILLSIVLAFEQKITWSPLLILSVAVIIRLIFLFHPPYLSDDIFRYMADGIRTGSGVNPYQSAPADVTTTDPTFSEILQKVNHPHLVTIYPPAAQIVFALGTFTKRITVMKALLVLMDLASIFLIILLLKKQNQYIVRSVLYAWHPLPVLEIASSGHIDAAGVFFVLLTIFLATSPQKKIIGWAGFFYSWAFLTKLFPILFLPGFLLFLKKEKWLPFFGGFIFGMVFLIFPFLPDIKNALPTLHTYAANWEFSGFGFRLLRSHGISGEQSRQMLLILFSGVTFVLYATFFFKYRKKQQNIQALFATLYAVSITYLLLTPTLHPWYTLYAALFLPFTAGVSGMVLSWAVLLSYYILIPYQTAGLWQENNLIPLLIFSGPAAAKCLQVAYRFLRRYFF